MAMKIDIANILGNPPSHRENQDHMYSGAEVQRGSDPGEVVESRDECGALQFLARDSRVSPVHSRELEDRYA